MKNYIKIDNTDLSPETVINEIQKRDINSYTFISRYINAGPAGNRLRLFKIYVAYGVLRPNIDTVFPFAELVKKYTYCFTHTRRTD